MITFSRLLISLIFIYFLSNMIIAQQKTTDTIGGLLVNKRYQECIFISKNALRTIPKEQLEYLPRITALAIAIDKTNKWGSEDEAEIRKLLIFSTTALHYFSAIRGIVHNNLSNVDMLFDEVIPKSSQWPETITLLRSNDYSIAADALESLFFLGATESNLRRKIAIEILKKGILQLASLSKENRKLIVRVVMKRFATDIEYRKLLSLTSLSLFFTSSQDKTISNEKTAVFYEISNYLGHSLNIMSIETVIKLANENKRSHAKILLTQLMKNYNDIYLLTRSCRIAWQIIGDNDFALQLYKDTINRVNEPYRHNVRVEYLNFIQWLRTRRYQGEYEFVENIQKDKNLLVAGDAYFIDGKLKQASELYSKVLKNTKSTNSECISAWGSLLMSDPILAINNMDTITLLMSDKDQQDDYASWIISEIWCAMKVTTLITNNERGILKNNWETKVISLATVPHWKKKIAEIVVGIYDTHKDIIVCRTNSSDHVSLRLPIALALCINYDTNKAIEVIHRKCDNIIPSNNSNLGSIGEYEDNSENVINASQADEVEHLDIELLTILSTYIKNSKEDYSETCKVLICDIVKSLSSTKTEENALRLIKQFNIALKLFIITLNTLYDIKSPELLIQNNNKYTEELVEIKDMMIKAFKNDCVAKCSRTLLREGILECMLYTLNPLIHCEFLDFAIQILDRYAEIVSNKSLIDNEVAYFVKYLELRENINMKPLAKQLQEHYLNKYL